jgi:hemerythrin
MLDDAAEPGAATRIPLLRWGSEADLGVAGMDRDHRALAALLDALGEALAAGGDEERLTALLDSLASLAAAHFSREEQWMDAHGYEDAPAHKAHHTELLEELAVLCLRIDTRSVILTMRYLNDWLCRHVQGSDRRLARAMLARGGDFSA